MKERIATFLNGPLKGTKLILGEKVEEASIEKIIIEQNGNVHKYDLYDFSSAKYQYDISFEDTPEEWLAEIIDDLTWQELEDNDILFHLKEVKRLIANKRIENETTAD